MKFLVHAVNLTLMVNVKYNSRKAKTFQARHGLHFYSFRAHEFPTSIVEADRGNARPLANANH